MDNPYAVGQLAAALTTASSHEDAATRQRADARVRAWLSVVDGMRRDGLSVGSREPVLGLPTWVSLQVVRGGFATGQALAGGPLEEDELARVARLGLPRSRAAVFESYLTDEGFAELQGLLDAGAYEVRLPEDAALLVVAWLAAAGDRATALDLLETLRPYAARLRFMPRDANPSDLPAHHVFRRTAAQVATALRSQQPRPAIEAQREALSVWVPLTDAFVALWTEDAVDLEGDWSTERCHRARTLLDSYDRALREHPRCRKYRNPKGNLPILVEATRAQVASGLTDAHPRRISHVLTSIAAKRGAPAGEGLRTLRAVQAGVAAMPGHHRLAAVAADRCGPLASDEGIRDVAAVIGPVAPDEATGDGLAAGVAMPTSVRRKVRLGATAPIDELVAAGVVPSAEVLAELVPGLTAQQVRAAYEDSRLGALLGRTYAAFRRRRSLLLLDLAKQVQFTELPWVGAVAPHARPGRPDDSLAVARRVAALAIDSFPGTILPNPLVQELSTLYAASGVDLPLTEELAADIFMGRFSDKFLTSAKIAAELLQGSLYESYYGLDFGEVLTLPDPSPRRRRLLRRRAPVGETLGDLCARGAPSTRRWSVAGNGAIIERQQVLSTHNLALLVDRGGVVPTRSWVDLASDATRHAAALLDQAQRQERPLASLKDASYAWRQAVFFATMAGGEETAGIPDRMAQVPLADRWPMTEVIGGLRHIVNGGSFEADGTNSGGRRLLGWTTERHWALGLVR